MFRYFFVSVLFTCIYRGTCSKLNCSDHEIVTVNSAIDNKVGVGEENLHQCVEVVGTEDSIVCTCGWYESCESYFDKHMPDNETIFVGGIQTKDTRTFYKCCWSSAFTYRVDNCIRTTQTADEMSFENNETHVTIIANINSHKSEFLLCTAEFKNNSFCYPPNGYPSTAGNDNAWIAGLVLGVLLPLPCYGDPTDCTVHADCPCSEYCAPTTGRCGQRTDGDLCATDDECIAGVCGTLATDGFFTAIDGTGYCNMPWLKPCTLGDHSPCGVGWCKGFSGGGGVSCSCWSRDTIPGGFQGWFCCNGTPNDQTGDPCNLVNIGDVCAVDIDCQKMNEPRYCRNGICSAT